MTCKISSKTLSENARKHKEVKERGQEHPVCAKLTKTIDIQQ